MVGTAARPETSSDGRLRRRLAVPMLAVIVAVGVAVSWSLLARSHGQLDRPLAREPQLPVSPTEVGTEQPRVPETLLYVSYDTAADSSARVVAKRPDGSVVDLQARGLPPLPRSDRGYRMFPLGGGLVAVAYFPEGDPTRVFVIDRDLRVAQLWSGDERIDRVAPTMAHSKGIPPLTDPMFSKRVLPTRNGDLAATPFPADHPHPALASPSGRLILVISPPHKIIDAVTGDELWKGRDTSQRLLHAVTADDSTGFLRSATGHNLQALDIRTGQVRTLAEFDERPVVVWAGETSVLVVELSSSDPLSAWWIDISDGTREPAGSIPHRQGLTAWHDGVGLRTGLPSDSTVPLLIDPDQRSIEPLQELEGLTVVSGGPRRFVLLRREGESGTARVVMLDLATGDWQVVLDMEGWRRAATGQQVSPTPCGARWHVGSASEDGRLQVFTGKRAVWIAEAGSLAEELPCDKVAGVTVLADGSGLAYGFSLDGQSDTPAHIVVRTDSGQFTIPKASQPVWIDALPR